MLVVALGLAGCASGPPPGPCFTPWTTNAAAPNAHPAVVGFAVVADLIACAPPGESARQQSLDDLERDLAISRDPVGGANDLLRDLERAR